jgi:hypothetical protein
MASGKASWRMVRATRTARAARRREPSMAIIAS